MAEDLQLNEYPIGCLYTASAWEDPNYTLPGTWKKISGDGWTRTHAEDNVPPEEEKYPLKDCVSTSSKHIIPVHGVNMILISYVDIYGINPHCIKKRTNENKEIYDMRGITNYINKIIPFGKINSELVITAKQWMHPEDVPQFIDNLAQKADMFLDMDYKKSDTNLTELEEFVKKIPSEYTCHMMENSGPDQAADTIRIDKYAGLDDCMQLIKYYFFAPPMTDYRLQLDVDIIRKISESVRRDAILKFCNQYKITQEMAAEVAEYMQTDIPKVTKIYEVKYE